uniref:Uncharacterized protein n=1 Tax=Meloidogyne javanica TaxID=6303 RepID=A0A915MDI3_MELJA
MSSLPIQRARPVIELNLNVEEAMIETVDLLRTAGEDLTKIIHNVETLSSNLADSTGQLYHPIMLDRLRRPNIKTKGNKNNETEEYSTDILKEESGGIQSFP